MTLETSTALYPAAARPEQEENITIKRTARAPFIHSYFRWQGCRG